MADWFFFNQLERKIKESCSRWTRFINLEDPWHLCQWIIDSLNFKNSINIFSVGDVAYLFHSGQCVRFWTCIHPNQHRADPWELEFQSKLFNSTERESPGIFDVIFVKAQRKHFPRSQVFDFIFGSFKSLVLCYPRVFWEDWMRVFLTPHHCVRNNIIKNCCCLRAFLFELIFLIVDKLVGNPVDIFVSKCVHEDEVFSLTGFFFF